MNKAVFLDRDGVINRERGEYTFKQDDFEFLPDLFNVLKEFQEQGYLLIVITNQGGIAKGLYSIEEFRKLNQWMLRTLNEHGLKVLKTYYSPDHNGFSKSLSRKPEGILFERAMHQYNIDPTQSFMIGDSQRDVDAAEKNKIKGILIKANSSLEKVKGIILDGSK